MKENEKRVAMFAADKMADWTKQRVPSPSKRPMSASWVSQPMPTAAHEWHMTPYLSHQFLEGTG